MSRTHPGTSQAFNRKVTRRKEREQERELLRLAKLMHYEKDGRDKPLDRVKIRRYKKDLRKQMNKGTLVLNISNSPDRDQKTS